MSRPLCFLTDRRQRAVPALAVVLLVAACVPPTEYEDPDEGPRFALVAVAGGHTFSSISAGGERAHTCAITTSGKAYCWGSNEKGELGNGSGDSPFFIPTPVKGDITFSAISAGDGHTCGLSTEGRLYCWGGLQTREPALIEENVGLVSLASGSGYSCGLSAEARAYCWEWRGQVRTDPQPLRGDLQLRSLSVAYSDACGLTDQGEVYCWSFGRLTETRPEQVAGDHRFLSLSLGVGHLCAVAADDVAYCWGWNGFGQLGTGNTTDAASPAAVVGHHAFSSISNGWRHTCALSPAGTAYCWGDNHGGQLGHRATEGCLLWGFFGPLSVFCALQPERVGTDVRFSQLSAGFRHTCGLSLEGKAYCWGWRGSPELGVPYP